MQQIRKHHIDFHITETRMLQPVQSQGRDKRNKEEMVQGNDQVCGAETALGLWTPVGCRNHATDRV